MELKYIGPKAMISERGISFKDGKDDKYVYINNAIQVYQAINHEYDKDTLYHHHLKPIEYSSNDVFKALKDSIENFEHTILDELKGYKNYLQTQEEEVQNRNNLNKDEKMAFVNNLKIMREYRTQRFINKHVYEHIIQAIATKIVEHQLHEIQTPFNERFWHILQTIEGWLSSEYNINSTLETKHTEDENIIIVLHIHKIY